MAGKRSYTAGNFELQIDGHATTAYIKSVEGGLMKHNTVDEPIGPENQRIKHASTLDIDPFSIEFGLSGAEEVLKWIQASWRKNYGRRNGQVSHANFDFDSTFEHEFYEALIQETTFPVLDGSSKEAAYLKIKVQPEHVVTRKGSGKIQPHGGLKQKMWLCSGFRLTLDGVDGMEYTNKIESFTIKQGTKKFYTGEERRFTVEPTKIEFPALQGSMALEFADGLLKWHEQYVANGMADPKAQKTGSLEFLAPDRKDALFRINLYEVGITSISMGSKANAGEIKRLKWELYVGRMDMDGGGALGFE